MNRRRVLIETLWNVKNPEGSAGIERRHVLIETLWNVKMQNYQHRIRQISINRNIVECKDKHVRSQKPFPFRINRNIVECKDDSYRNSVRWRFRINRNIVECKE